MTLFYSVMGVKFVRNTHYLFSIGKDRLVKYWDADKFELLLTLEGHHAEIWCLAVSNRGDFLVTGSHDRSMRRWDRSEEPFFLEVIPNCGRLLHYIYMLKSDAEITQVRALNIKNIIKQFYYGSECRFGGMST